MQSSQSTFSTARAFVPRSTTTRRALSVGDHSDDLFQCLKDSEWSAQRGGNGNNMQSGHHDSFSTTRAFVQHPTTTRLRALSLGARNDDLIHLMDSERLAHSDNITAQGAAATTSTTLTPEKVELEPEKFELFPTRSRHRVSYSDRIQLSGELFEAVQHNRVFSDSKHYVDMLSVLVPGTVIDKWKQEKDNPDFDLGRFVGEHFELPKVPDVSDDFEHKEKCREHIQTLWPLLFRHSDDLFNPSSSLIPLPHHYVVPGGRFREVYYWDTYFTAHGLIADGHREMALNMAKNFKFMIDTYGHVPNGNRLYYVSRSQPPFYIPLVALMAVEFGEDIIPEFYEEAVLEYTFWADSGGDPERRYVTFTDPEGRSHSLNRYWDDNPVPREESWIEDKLEFEASGAKDAETFYRDIRAACESGWDFTSRWFADRNSITTIETTAILPVDLNTVLWFCETKLSEWSEKCGHPRRAEKFRDLADSRKESINELMWDTERGFYFDYHLHRKTKTESWSLAAIYPLYFGLATQSQAEAIAENLVEYFLQDGGLLTTTANTGQQWDAPNGWAPLQWMAIVGLQQYGMTALADEIRLRWLKLNEKVYAESGKMVEKYNVVNLDEKGGGGEYPLQDGFGWTNGVFSALSARLDNELQVSGTVQEE